MKYFIQKHNQIWVWDLPEESLEMSEAVIAWDYKTFKKELEFAKNLGKKVILYQHGRYALEEYYHYDKLYDLNIDGLLVWGQREKDMMSKRINPDKIMVVGNKWVEEAKRYKRDIPIKDSYKVCYPVLHWDKPYLQENTDLIKSINKFIRKDDKFLIKTTERAPWGRYSGQVLYDPKQTEVVETKIESDSGQNKTIGLLADVDLIISPRESTFELYARAMGIEVINVDSTKIQKLKFMNTQYPEVNKPFQNRCQMSRLPYAYKRFKEGYRTAKLFDIDYEAGKLATAEEINNFIEKL